MEGPLRGVRNYVERQGIYSLQDDLDEILSNIAFEGHSDLRYIYYSSKRLERKYSFLAEQVAGFDDSSLFDLAVTCIGNAYNELVNNFYDWVDIGFREREQRAYNILGENHFLGEGFAIPLTYEINRLEVIAEKSEKELFINGQRLCSNGEFEIDYEFV